MLMILTPDVVNPKRNTTSLEPSESCGLAVEHLAHDRKLVGSIPIQC